MDTSTTPVNVTGIQIYVYYRRIEIQGRGSFIKEE